MEDPTTRRLRLELAEAIETTGGPSRLFDCRIWLLYGPVLGRPHEVRGRDPIMPSEIVQGRWFGSALDKYPEDVQGVALNWRVPHFTSSRDAAGTLLANIGYVLWHPVGKSPSVSTQIDGAWSEYSTGANDAIAMCVAALRAGGPVFHRIPDDTAHP